MSAETDWHHVPSDPDATVDLGYEFVDLDVIPTVEEGRSRVIVLPTDEDMLREDAFVLVDEDDLCDLETMV
jgi:hypothetical protein